MPLQQCDHGSAAPTEVLETLPHSQAGAGRHKCVICAFQRGFEGVNGAPAENCNHANAAPIPVLQGLPDSQAVPGVARHKCAVCAFAAGVAAAGAERQYPDEVPAAAQYPEGATRQVAVNQYERSARARAACIAHYGLRCAVCEMDFEAVYGADAAGLIHVHHLREIAGIGEAYQVDPIQDLRPVCPNCHAVIHRGKPIHSIDAVRAMLQGARAGRAGEDQ